MKKIINGKVYSTETARQIAFWCNTGDRRSFSYCEETLYCKRTGEYFLDGFGGPLSKYAVNLGNNEVGGGEKIIPLAYEEARKWAEEHMDASEYEAEFGLVDEEDTVHLHISLPANTADIIRKLAAAEGVSVSECIARRFAPDRFIRPSLRP